MRDIAPHFSVKLCSVEPWHLKQIMQWRNDAELLKLTWRPRVFLSSFTVDEYYKNFSRLCQSPEKIPLSIVSNDDKESLIGFTSLEMIDYVNRSVFCGGFVIGNNDYRDGQAIIDAIWQVLFYVFQVLNMHRFYGVILKENIMSRSINESFFLSSCGFGRDAIYKNGVYHDVEYVQILNREFVMHDIQGDYETSKIMNRLAKAIRTNRKRT